MQQNVRDELFMRRALELGEKGAGSVSPNPLVGCVIVSNNEVIGEGWHKQFGGPHAEVNAIADVMDKQRIPGSTVYVTLEPCSHFGKTPPCADLLIREQVGRVVIANTDSNPLVSGKGIEKLRAAGITVDTDILKDEARWINRRFFTFIEKKQPFVILKWAQTSDGFIARKNFDSKWISGEMSRKLVHKWRTEEDAILVGFNTALKDNPRLNVRDWVGRDPVRIVIDPKLKLPNSFHLFDKSQRTIVINEIRSTTDNNIEFVQTDDCKDCQSILSILYERKIQSVIVEGGAQTLEDFINQDCWDEARVFTNTQNFVEGIKAPRLEAKLRDEISIEKDVLAIFTREHF